MKINTKEQYRFWMAVVQRILQTGIEFKDLESIALELEAYETLLEMEN